MSKRSEANDKIKARINSVLLEALVGNLVKEKQQILETLSEDMSIYNKDVIYYLVMKLRSLNSILDKITEIANKEIDEIEKAVDDARKKSKKKIFKEYKKSS